MKCEVKTINVTNMDSDFVLAVTCMSANLIKQPLVEYNKNTSCAV